MASVWHKKTQEKIINEFEENGYIVRKEEKIGFSSPTKKETQFKQVDVIAKKQNTITLIEIEDREYKTKKGPCEYGIGYVELGGILYLTHLFSMLNPTKKVRLLLVFGDKLVDFRKKNIEEMIRLYRQLARKQFEIEIQYRN